MAEQLPVPDRLVTKEVQVFESAWEAICKGAQVDGRRVRRYAGMVLEEHAAALSERTTVAA